MSRPIRMLRSAALVLLALIVVLGVAGILLVQSAWFQNYIKQTIISSTDQSTGGRTEVGTFRFEWRRFRAVATDFVIHGSEAPGADPLLRVARVQFNLRLFTSLHHLWDITYLGIERPQANVIVFPDGRTNFPSPRHRPSEGKSPLETVVDLAIGHFDLTDGILTLAEQKHALNLHGNNLKAQLSYNILSQEYRGQLSLQLVYVAARRNTPVNFTVIVLLVISRDRVDLRAATISSPGSAVTVNASIQNLKNLTISAHAAGHIALADLKNAINAPLWLNARNAPSVIDLDAGASSANNSIQVAGLRASLGRSSIQVSGSLDHGLAFQSRLDLGQLAGLFHQPGLSANIADFSGTATLDPQNSYAVRGDLKSFDLKLLSYDG